MNSKISNQTLYSSRIDLSEEIRLEVISILGQTLTTTIDLKTQTKQAHWNVKGLNFYQLHELFDRFASELEEFTDLVAERITALGGIACGTARVVAAQSSLPEYPLDALQGIEHLTALAERFSLYGRHLREAIDRTDELGDKDTADLYTQISRTVDKDLWFLEAHLVE